MKRKSILVTLLLGICFVTFILYGGKIDGALFQATYKTYGLNFSPYIEDNEDPDLGGSQITDEELEERLGLIAPYTEWIRTFGCNDDLKEAGMYAHTMGLNSAVGAWLGRSATENNNQIECLVERAKEGHVDVAIVGSEVLLRGDLSEAALIGYINEVKDSLQAAGIDIPVTYADVYGVLLDHPNVMDTVDIVLVNYYPYWEGRKVDYAVAHLHRQHQEVVAAAGGKEVIVSETGWPSCGNQIGDAVPSPENASFFFLNFVSWARANNVKYFYFEAYDEGWKTKHEGPQGACWGIWDKEGTLKPGMQSVFDGDTIPDNWTDPIPDSPIIDFSALPEFIETNISTFVIASFTDTSNGVWLNGNPFPPDAMDLEGNFALTVPLLDGDNLIELVIKSGEDTVKAVYKTVHFDSSFSTQGKKLLYIDSVLGEGMPALPGTIVIDIDGVSLLGIIEDKHVVGASPDGSEIYMSDRSIFSTTTQQEIRTLAFTYDIPSNGFIVSPKGDRLYSRNERLDVQSNSLLENLPMDITTGSSWCSAAIPGGPTISRDGRYIYCGNYVHVIDTEENTATNTGFIGSFMSDIAISPLSPDRKKILISEYSYERGRFDVYNAVTFELLGTISSTKERDFAGEIVFSRNGQMAIWGSAGNPARGDGKITVVDLDKLEMISQVTVPLADNLVKFGDNEFFASSGGSGLFRRLGVDMYVLDPTGSLVRIKTFFLGINGYRRDSCRPKNDQIRRIVCNEDITTGISPKPRKPSRSMDLRIQSYPNPFNPTTIIEYQTPIEDRVRLTIHDVNGRLINTIFDGIKTLGKHKTKWDGKDQHGLSVASGIYFIRLESGGKIASKKIVMVK